MNTIPLFKVFMSSNVDKPLLKTLHGGWIGQGDKVKEFETLISNYTENPYCLSLSCGTHGLHLALRLLNIGRGDEVITTPLTCTATNWPILMQDADIVWADIDASDLNISPRSIEEQLTTRTKAIIVVHWGGYPADLDAIKKIADAARIAVIEDAAHAFGATYLDTRIGSCTFSEFTMFSFQAIKLLTTVDGGMLCCRGPVSYEIGKLLRWYGIDREGPRKDMRCEEDIVHWGYKYHMNDVCATIGVENFPQALRHLEVCRDNAAYYDAQLQDVLGVELTQQEKNRESSYWLYTILVEDRSGFSRMMGEKGIMVSRVHERNDLHSCVKHYRAELPVLETIMPRYICIPVGWWVNKADREYIVNCIKEGW